MSTATETTEATSHQTLGEIAASSTAAIEAFDRLGLDYCCDGDRTLGDAAERAGVGVDLLVNRIGAGNDTPAAEVSMTTEALIDHIAREYHEPHRRNLPGLIELARRVEAVHQFDADTPHGLSEALTRLQFSLVADMAEEERGLFPAIRNGDCTVTREMIHGLQTVRRRYADDIHAIEDIANGFDLPPGACPSWQRLYFGTARLVDELRYHIHLEHNVLFPRLLAERQG